MLEHRNSLDNVLAKLQAFSGGKPALCITDKEIRTFLNRNGEISTDEFATLKKYYTGDTFAAFPRRVFSLPYR